MRFIKDLNTRNKHKISIMSPVRQMYRICKTVKCFSEQYVNESQSEQ